MSDYMMSSQLEKAVSCQMVNYCMITVSLLTANSVPLLPSKAVTYTFKLQDSVQNCIISAQNHNNLNQLCLLLCYNEYGRSVG